MESRLIATLDDNSSIPEQYRNLFTRMVSSCGYTGKRCFLFTSSVPEEGKSLTAINLGIAISRLKREDVILVDADLRRPALHTMLDVKPGGGLVNHFRDYYREAGEESDVPWEDLVHFTHLKQLYLVPAGQAAENPAEIISSGMLPNALRGLKRIYKNAYMIIDSPPLLPVSDAVVLSQHVDWTILVVRAGKTPREMVRKAAGFLEPQKMLGVVMNGLEFIPCEYTYKR